MKFDMCDAHMKRYIKECNIQSRKLSVIANVCMKTHKLSTEALTGSDSKVARNQEKL